jgi:hypothetical protein
MKWAEWVVVLALIVIGLSCLTVSGTMMLNPDSIRPYLNTLIQICIWAGIPVLFVTAVYFILKRK